MCSSARVSSPEGSKSRQELNIVSTIEKIDAEDITLNGFSKLLKFFFIEQYQTECHIKNCYAYNGIKSSNKSSEDD